MNAAIQPREGPNPIDVHVGARIRARRKTLGISQEQLATGLCLTFQQVQKYERGANRVSASKLYEIARALQTSIAFFFEGLADTVSSENEIVTPDCVRDLVMSRTALSWRNIFPGSNVAQSGVRYWP